MIAVPISSELSASGLSDSRDAPFVDADFVPVLLRVVLFLAVLFLAPRSGVSDMPGPLALGERMATSVAATARNTCLP
jgi:hypothetical protein